jgi:PAS domain S-box-containing protein
MSDNKPGENSKLSEECNLLRQKLAESERRYDELARTLEEQVRQRTAEVQDLYDRAPCGYHSLDSQGCFVRINQTELDWLGYVREEVIGRQFLEFITPESRAVYYENFPEFLKRGSVHELEFVMVRKDGSTFPALLSATAVRDEAGNFIMSRSTMFDITDRKKAEAALRESEETYRTLFEVENDGIFLLNLDGTYQDMNPSAPAMMGYDSIEELMKRPVLKQTAPEENEDARERWNRALTGERMAPYERTFVQKDGTRIHTEVSLSLLRDHAGQPKLLQSVVRDITQRKLAEETLKQANLELERAVRMKDEFLAAMSHELRTPLTSILGLTEALQERVYGAITEKQHMALATIDENGRRLLELINNILDVTRIGGKQLWLEKELCQLDDICQSALHKIGGMAEKKQQRVEFSIHPAGITVMADPRRLRQILVNLLTNAVKYSPEHASLGLEAATDSGSDWVSLTVWDTGMGIAAADLERIFNPFLQLDGSLARAQSGIGLGLTLAKQLVELHGGRLAVESRPGQGSRFTVWLPKSLETAPSAPEAAAGTALDRPKARVVIVDDDPFNIMVLDDYLQARGLEVFSFGSGPDFLEKLAEIRPDVVLMDIQMPGMDGLEVIRQVRSKADTYLASIPIVALTALAMSGDRERCLEAGANAYLSKPISLKETMKEIKRLMV